MSSALCRPWVWRRASCGSCSSSGIEVELSKWHAVESSSSPTVLGVAINNISYTEPFTDLAAFAGSI